MPVHPLHPRHLEGSRWTRRNPPPETRGLVHYEVTSFTPKRGLVRLRAVLDACIELELPWRALRDRERWLPGWATGQCQQPAREDGEDSPA